MRDIPTVAVLIIAFFLILGIVAQFVPEPQDKPRAFAIVNKSDNKQLLLVTGRDIEVKRYDSSIVILQEVRR